MTNVNHSILIQFSRSALIRPTSKASKTVIHDLRASVPSSRIRHYGTPTCSRTRCWFDKPIVITFKRYLSSNKQQSGTEHGASGTQDEQAWERSSSFHHQQFHRKKYERRRTNRYEESASTGAGAQSKSHTSSMNHYQRLNVSSDADLPSIKSAYYSLSKVYHPDVVGPNNSEAVENFRLITESYDALSDPKIRAEYDRALTSEMNSNERDDLSTSECRPKKDSSPVFRMRNSDMIFRMKQEAAFEREKLENPTKFRAGSFKTELGDFNREEELARINRQIHAFDYESARNKASQTDGSDFYRLHLYENMHRRRQDILQQETNRERDSMESPSTSIMFALGILAIAGYFITSTVSDIDIAGSMDNALQNKIQEFEKQKRLKTESTDIT